MTEELKQIVWAKHNLNEYNKQKEVFPLDAQLALSVEQLLKLIENPREAELLAVIEELRESFGEPNKSRDSKATKKGKHDSMSVIFKGKDYE